MITINIKGACEIGEKKMGEYSYNCLQVMGFELDEITRRIDSLVKDGYSVSLNMALCVEQKGAEE